jgi:hypothetical protein
MGDTGEDRGAPSAEVEHNPLSDRVDLRKLPRRHLLWAKMYEVHAAWLAAIGGRWFNAQAVIALHYAALHLLDCWLIGARAMVCKSHDEQSAAIAECKELFETNIGDLYLELRNYSETARYRMRGYSRAQYEYLLEYQFLPIKRALVKLIIAAGLATRAELRHQQTLFAELRDDEQFGERAAAGQQ